MRTARLRFSTARTIALGSATVLLVALGTVACSDQATAPPTAIHSSAELVSAPTTVTPAQQARIDRATARMRWVGESHDEAMKVVRRHIANARPGRGRPAKLDARAKCRAIEEASDVALTVIDRANGRGRTRAQRAVQVQSSPEFKACARQLSVSSASVVATSATQAAEVTGAFEPYATLMYNAVVASGGSVYGVRAAVNGVLQQAVAAGLPDPDLDVLAAMGSVANASAEEWNAFDWSSIGGGDGSGCTLSTSCEPLQMSMFSAAADGWSANVAKVVLADVGGCLKSLSGWGALRTVLRMTMPALLASDCGFRAAQASAGAILLLM